MIIPRKGSPPPTHVPGDPERDRLFQLSLDLLCVAGLDGYFRQVNPSWTRVLGWSETELLSRPVADFIHPDDRERTLRARAELARGGVVKDLENRYLCKDGSYRWLSWQSSAEPGGATVFAVARDVTVRRQTDQERLLLGKLESTGTLAGGLAHDFNNILTSLLLNLEMMDLSGSLNDAQSRHLGQARGSVLAARSLIQQLLAFAEATPVSPRSVPVMPLLERAAASALDDPRIHFVLTQGTDLWPVEVGAAEIEQVLCSLLFNAREALASGGEVRLHAENAPGDGERPDRVLIRIRDEGVGIAPEDLARVFDPYFSTKPRSARKGMGLSLTICHAIIKKYRGEISIESALGRGTTVSCHLPAARAAA